MVFVLPLAGKASRWAERCKMEGSRNIQVTPNITLGCISPEARDLLDTIVAEYQKHYDGMVAMNLKGTHPDDVYGAFYWLVRWSGLVQPNIACTGQGAGAGNADGVDLPQFS